MNAQAYARTYRTNAVMTATPGQLVLMLYDGALRFLELAKSAFAQPAESPHRIEEINQHLLKAQAIITELQSGLNLQEGGEFAQTMNRLYSYHNRRLFEANLRKDPAPVAEVERLLREIRNAWAEMLVSHAGNPQTVHMRGVG
ncbi:MAG: flagellar export chaperone FliS [Verrucomicrobiota bacterium]|jgi:flagellar protein FliS